ncbi:MAG: hypothetical protein MH204_00135, partial [Fimbriimonadaceae bacterium]|nr:hypothetical protein [Fimbriimonadaceae bacterium]
MKNWLLIFCLAATAGVQAQRGGMDSAEATLTARKSVSGAWLLRNDPNFLGDGLTRTGNLRRALESALPIHLRRFVPQATQRANRAQHP